MGEYVTFQEQIRSHLDKGTRESIIFLLSAPRVDQEDLVDNARKMVAYLDDAKLIQRNNVKPFLSLLKAAKNPGLNTLISIVENYQSKIAH
jgi:hypothetical protein